MKSAIVVVRMCVIAMVLILLYSTNAVLSQEMTERQFILKPIGFVQKEKGRTTLVLNKEFEPALRGLEGFSHVWVFWWFDRNDTPKKRSILQVHPQGNRKNPLTGVFACRSPVRPNPIALTLCQVLSVGGNVVEIDKIDAFANTPILDLKPYIPGYDSAKASVPNWLRNRSGPIEEEHGERGKLGLPEAVEKEFVRFDDPDQIVIASRFAQLLKKLRADQIREAKSRLRARLQSKIPEIRRRAALTLHSLGDDSGVAVMIRDMKEVTDQRDRNNIVVALRVMKDSRAVPALIDCAYDASPYIRSIALAALGELKAADAYEAIVEHLHDYETEEGDCFQTCPAHLACYALGALGDKGAIPHLIEALDHEETRAAACKTLGKLTGEQFGYDAAKWKQWWEKEKANKRMNADQ
ncbi:MAG: tRNA (N6-threonylcarbamoyladenosine(37)-N6)-methyltransferase TrmO [Verrucomicrobia bacterium]|nr:tRNA (N6-threonylcarbamoyladenosine(37)-N6)-methyltransferase TrmO [Verrucomicrobiota bacterium]